MESYNPKEIESKWQKYWAEKGTFKDYSKENKFYALDMFPYPSGVGLHVGHPKGYIATDVIAHFKMLQGYSVLHPMGWDAFGLPAENYAIKNKVHPRIAVEKNIATFKKQLESFGFTYDWDREIDTTDPNYYKWTQWIFLKMFERGLAYESEEPVNWCPTCKTGLALEDLEKGLCERCGSQVIKKKLRQWVLKMTDYADRLLYDLDTENLDWEKSIIEQQKNWIGRSEGAEFELKIKDSNEVIKVYTTRLDTVFGMTYVVIAPEHSIIEKLKNVIENYSEVEAYQIQAQNKTDLERTELQKEKTGIELKGVRVINPFTNEELPLFAADYVLGNYGTGAVMAVPAHDERDFEFAKKYNLSIKPVIFKQENESRSFVMGIDENKLKELGVSILEKTSEGFLKIKIPFEKLEEYKGLVRKIMEPGFWNEFSTQKGFNFIFKHKDGHLEEMELNEQTNDTIDKYGASFNDEKIPEKPQNVFSWPSWIADDAFYKDLLIHTEYGNLINSNEYSGLSSEEAREKMIRWLEEKEIGKRKVNYKMRDWVFSRQRYWGEPIPIVHCKKCGTVAVPENQLPVTLPDVESYEPTGTGESPLANIFEWVNTTCPKCGGPGKREANTMPQWAGSSWYYLRYIDPKNNNILVDKKKEEEWMPVDLYVGGAEHATRHLLYARFWHKFLYDIGVVTTKEPFRRLVYVGLILAEDGRKMSKRWNNVINPDDVINEFGADAMRVYEMFMGPFTQNISWSTAGVSGARRFLEKVYRLANKVRMESESGANKKLESLLHKTIKKVSEDIENFRFNTAISSLMILTNEMEKEEKLPVASYELLIALLSPFAPHIAEELWNKLGRAESIFREKWPRYDPELIKEEEIELVVQISGKMRAKIKTKADISEDEAKELALSSGRVKSFLDGREIKKIIFVQGKLINIVV